MSAEVGDRRVEGVLPYWLDRPDEEALDIALAVEEAGLDALWIGELVTFDAVALATAIGDRTERLRLKLGPLAVGVRSRTRTSFPERPSMTSVAASRTTSMPSSAKIARIASATSGSSRGASCGPCSITVTRLPSRRKACAISRPT